MVGIDRTFVAKQSEWIWVENGSFAIKATSFVLVDPLPAISLEATRPQKQGLKQAMIKAEM